MEQNICLKYLIFVENAGINYNIKMTKNEFKIHKRFTYYNLLGFRHQAFSLAELLLAVTIIGIVASYTIPSLLQNIEDATFKAAFKKIFSTLNSALTLSRQDNGGVLNACNSSDCVCLGNIFLNHFNYIKTCNSLGQGCWPGYGKFYYFNGVPVTSVWQSPFAQTPAGNNPLTVVLSNGVSLLFRMPGTWDSEIAGIENRHHIKIGLDVNGLKGPNVLGRDIFLVYLYKDRLYPYGSSLDQLECSKTTVFTAYTAAGMGCTAKVLLNQEY